MLLRVNPTRMELLRLKQRLQLARRGHKLLKDKLEGLMRNFLFLAGEFVRRKAEFDRKMLLVQSKYYASVATYTDDHLDMIFSENAFRLNLEIGEGFVMNIRYPKLKAIPEGNAISYPLVMTDELLDDAFSGFLEILPELVSLASLQQQIFLVAFEISKTRRRVNALEYVMIPNLEETTKYITGKLEEMERSNISRLLKIKDLIRGH